MALTITTKRKWYDETARQWHLISNITFDSSYPTGGEAIIPADVGFVNRIETVNVIGASSSTNGKYMFAWDYTNGKIVAYMTTAAQVSTLAATVGTALTGTVTSGTVTGSTTVASGG